MRTQTRSRRWLRLTALLVVLGLTAVACSDNDDDPAAPSSTGDGRGAATTTGGSDGGSATEGGSDGGAALGGLQDCPNPIVFQTDWFPEPEHGALYNLTAGKGDIEAESGVFTGPLAADPSIEVEIRAGGPFVGGQQTVALMGIDDSVFLAYTNTDEAIQNYTTFPTKAVMAPLDINPQIIMWDPATYSIDSWDQVKSTRAVISHSAGAAYTEYLVGAGLVDAEQLDPSYDGSPSRFVAENGAIMQQGFATQEPYKYEHDIEAWDRPVGFLLIHDSGYEVYQGALSILDSKLDDAARSCLTALIPLVQQSAIDFQDDPEATNELLLRIVDEMDTFWVLTEDGVADTVTKMEELEIVGNGPDDTVGNFDLDRVNGLIDVIRTKVPSIKVPADLTADDVVTNEFIDPSIGF